MEHRLTVSGGWVLRSDPQLPSPYSGCEIATGARQSFNAEAFVVLGLLGANALTPDELAIRLSQLGVPVTESALRAFLRDSLASGLLSEAERPVAIRTVGGDLARITSDVPVASAPFDAEVHLTAGCNLRCRHCYIDATRPRPLELDAEAWCRIADEMEDLSLFSVVVSGGEPLSHPQAEAILRHFARKHFRTSLLTNGVLLSEAFADVLSAANVTLSVSLDGADAATHDALRGRGTFSRLMRAFALLRDTGASWIVSITATRNNLGQLERIIDLARAYGARGAGIARFDLMGRAKENADLALDSRQSENIASRMRAMRAAAGRDFSILLVDMTDPDNSFLSAEARRRRERSTCSAGTTRLVIRSDGAVFPCVLAFDIPSMRVGRIGERSMRELWRDGEWTLFRGGIRTDELRECAACALADTCVMKNCRLRALRYRGDLYAASCRTIDVASA